MIKVIAFGIVTVFLMLLVEDFIAITRRRPAEPGTVLICGLFGVAFFIGMMYALGALP